MMPEPSVPHRRGTGKIVLHDLPGSVSRLEIEEMCREFGEVLKIEQSASENVVNVIYHGPDEAERAVSELNNKDYNGTTLRVEIGGNNKRRTRNNMMPNGNLPKNNDLPLRLLVPTDMVGAVIGRGGTTIRQITHQTRARVDVLRKETPTPGPHGAKEKLVTIFGSPESCSSACKEIMSVLRTEANSTGRQEPVLKILVGNQFCGRIIGRGGKSLEAMMKESDTTITVSNQLYAMPPPMRGMGRDFFPQECGGPYGGDRVITITGDLESVSAAEKLVSSKVRLAHEKDMAKNGPMMNFHAMHMGGPPQMGGGGYTNMRGRGDPFNGGNMSPYYQQLMSPFMFGPPHATSQQPVETTFVLVPHTSVGAIIGTRGAHIRDIIARSGAQVKVESKDETNPTAERRVTIIGTPIAQWHAQCYVYDCLRPEFQQGYDEPSMHVEMVVPKGMMGRIIGKQHCNIREIKNISGAMIKIPEEDNQPLEVTLSIVGGFYANQYAQRRIRALIMSTQQRSPPNAASPGGDPSPAFPEPNQEDSARSASPSDDGEHVKNGQQEQLVQDVLQEA